MTKIIPRHIAIIMDGNGRWAKQRGLPRIKGHEKGAEAVRECVEGCGELKVEYLTLYAFSAENWQRPKSEVFALMRLLEKFLKDKTPELVEKNVRLQAIGRLTDLPDNCQKRLHESIKRTAGNTGLTLILALSYGGRDEIIDGIRSLLREVEAGWPSAVSADLNAEHVTLSEDEIRERMSGNLCRCAAYANIVPAIAEVLSIRSPDAERRSGSFVGDRNKEVKP